MRQIDEQRITAMAPNANAVNNARKISRGNGFIKWERSADDTYYAGQCKGSGSSVYTAVSYTHLDVYKRQGGHHGMSGAGGHV